MKRTFTIAACLLALVATTHTKAVAQTSPRTVARLFWQDSDSRTVRWGDLKRGDAWSLQVQELAAFPKLDSERQSLVQMQHSDGLILAGVHDTEDANSKVVGWPLSRVWSSRSTAITTTGILMRNRKQASNAWTRPRGTRRTSTFTRGTSIWLTTRRMA